MFLFTCIYLSKWEKFYCEIVGFFVRKAWSCLVELFFRWGLKGGKFGFLYVCLQLVVFDDRVYYSNGKLKAPTEMKSIETL